MVVAGKKAVIFDEQALEASELEKVLGFKEEHFKLFNQAARALFFQKRWQDASDAYFFLTTVKPLQPTFWLGLGMSEGKRERHEQAVQAFSMAALLLHSDPYPSLLLAKSLEKSGERSEALIALDRVILLAQGCEEAERLLAEAEALKERWS